MFFEHPTVEAYIVLYVINQWRFSKMSKAYSDRIECGFVKTIFERIIPICTLVVQRYFTTQLISNNKKL
jgi:hypothetical protein